MNDEEKNKDLENLPPKVKDAIKDLPPDSQLQLIEMATHYRGPLPDPNTLAKYDQIVPNGAERIFKRFEEQSLHRMEIEKKVIQSNIEDSKRGQIFGFTIAMMFLIASFILAMLDHEVVASVLGGTTVVGLVTTFVVGRKSQAKELKEKE